ncbi:hypothetical protein VNO80_29446 [Phaseolus coccineus]|uniref:Uncharacterized protein n=1 Tax=Phaseolus coccineus TaxID=3886 RepID=A0AAN9QF11_PHACN
MKITGFMWNVSVVISEGKLSLKLKKGNFIPHPTLGWSNIEIFMKFAECSYEEKIWDRVVGVVIVERLDFSKGMDSESLDKGIIA